MSYNPRMTHSNQQYPYNTNPMGFTPSPVSNVGYMTNNSGYGNFNLIANTPMMNNNNNNYYAPAAQSSQQELTTYNSHSNLNENNSEIMKISQSHKAPSNKPKPQPKEKIDHNNPNTENYIPHGKCPIGRTILSILIAINVFFIVISIIVLDYYHISGTVGVGIFQLQYAPNTGFIDNKRYFIDTFCTIENPHNQAGASIPNITLFPNNYCYQWQVCRAFVLIGVTISAVCLVLSISDTLDKWTVKLTMSMPFKNKEMALALAFVTICYVISMCMFVSVYLQAVQVNGSGTVAGGSFGMLIISMAAAFLSSLGYCCLGK